MTVRIDVDGGVAAVTLDRPERMNALSDAMKVSLVEAFDRFASDAAVRVVILRGSGRAFCAGADLAAERDASVPGGRERLRLAHAVIRGIASLDKPVIAAVGGVAVGIGWSLALASDFILASPSARFGQVFRKVGLAPDGGAAFLLSKYVGVLRAKELAMTGRIVDGDEAARLGLVTELVPDDRLDARAREIADDLAGGASLALGMTKRMFDAVAGSDFARFLEIESHIQNQLLQTRDHREGVEAFLAKRKPVFEGR